MAERVDHLTVTLREEGFTTSREARYRPLELLASHLRGRVVFAARRTTKLTGSSRLIACAVSLAVERPLHTRKVTGSNPVPRTPSPGED